MYTVKIYMVDGDVHFIKADELNLQEFKDMLDEDTSPKYVEIYCEDASSVFCVARDKVEAYEYKLVSEDN